MQKGDILYKLVDTVVASGYFDEYGSWRESYLGPDISVCWQTFFVVKTTPKGAWIRQGTPGDTLVGMKKWVRSDTTFVSPTKELAYRCAIEKREYHVKMCAKRTQLAQRRLQALQREGMDEQ